MDGGNVSRWSNVDELELDQAIAIPPGGTPIEYLTGDGIVIWSPWFNISKTRKPQFCKLPFEIIQGEIAIKNTVQCINKQIVAPCVAHRYSYRGSLCCERTI